MDEVEGGLRGDGAQNHRLVHVESILQPLGKRGDMPAQDCRHQVGIQCLTRFAEDAAGYGPAEAILHAQLLKRRHHGAQRHHKLRFRLDHCLSSGP